MTEAFVLTGRITLDDSDVTTKLQGARQGLNSFGQELTKFGLGASIALAPVTLFFTQSISSFQQFETSMTNAQAILGITTDEMEALNDQVLAIGGASRAGPQKAAEAFYTIVSGVADASLHMDILQSSIALSEAGMADLSVTTDGLVAVMNAYRFAAEDTTFVSDIFTRTVQTGVGTMDEFVAALTPISGLASTVGIDFDELAGSMAYLTTQGTGAQQSATQLQAVMVAFLKPNEAMKQALADMGFESGEAALQMLGLDGAVAALSDSVDGSNDAMAQALGSTEALNAAVKLGTDRSEEFLEAFTAGADGATAAAQQIQNATDAAGLDLFNSRLEELRIILGEKLSAALTDVAEAMTPVIEDIINWIEENPELTKNILLFTGALIVGAGAAMALGAAITLATSPIVLLGLAVIGAIWWLDKMAKALGFEGVNDMLKSMVESWIGNIEMFIEIVEKAINKIGELAGFNVEFDPFAGKAGFSLGGETPRGEGGFSAGRTGFATGGEFGAFQPITVGEEGPETVVFPTGGQVMNNQASQGINIDSMTINANSYEEGRAAARGFNEELTLLRMEQG